MSRSSEIACSTIGSFNFLKERDSSSWDNFSNFAGSVQFLAAQYARPNDLANTSRSLAGMASKGVSPSTVCRSYSKGEVAACEATTSSSPLQDRSLQFQGDEAIPSRCTGVYRSLKELVPGRPPPASR